MRKVFALAALLWGAAGFVVNAECRMQNAELEYAELEYAECRMQNAEFENEELAELEYAECRMQNAELADSMRGEANNSAFRILHSALREVMVSGVRAAKHAPFAVANIGQGELESFSRTGQELPFLLARTPGVMAWGENGLGTGTTYLRIRGAGDSRINVTLDGVPLNSPEDQCVFWANMNSYASLLGSVQIQRGVGTSTNGDGAFGGTVSLQTRAPQLSPSTEVTSSYGSFNTWKAGGRVSTGLLWDHLVLEGAYNETQTDGFVHGTAGRSGSYFAGLTWMGRNITVRYKNIGNFEKTGQAWNGVIAGDYDGYAPLNVSYADLYRMGYGRLNSLYEHVEADGNGGLTAERYQMKDGTLWPKTTDNYWQNHNILSLAWRVSDRWTTTAALRYTYGYGYYTEFKQNNKLSKYGLPTFTLADGSTLKKTDFVRKKGLDQDTYGLFWNANYTSGRWSVLMGLSEQMFEGNHFGFLTYMKNDELEGAYMTDGRYKYYDSDAVKYDQSAYVKASVELAKGWSAFADMQYRHVNYSTTGYNDKYNADLTRNVLDISKRYDFLNPKAGLTYTHGGHKAYASFALSHREPERNNFTDNASYPAPRAERLLDYEAGYEFTARRWHAALNLYRMDYRDQFVQTGAVSDIGEALTTNIARSYRMGVELSAGVNVLPWLSLEGNLALSQNRIKDFDEVVGEVYDADWNALPAVTNHYDQSTLAYSPALIGNAFLNVHHRGFSATWRTGGVSRQYVDNSESLDRSVPGFCTSDFSAAYTFGLGQKQARRFVGGGKETGGRNLGKSPVEVELGLNVNNIFNRHYAASGFVWYQSIVAGVRSSQMSYIPSAGTTVMGSATFRF